MPCVVSYGIYSGRVLSPTLGNYELGVGELGVGCVSASDNRAVKSAALLFIAGY